MSNNKLTQDMKQYLSQELKMYEESVPMTLSERKELRKWVVAGHSAYDNPDYIYREDGHPMNYINTIRFYNEMCEEFIQQKQSTAFEPGCAMDISPETTKYSREYSEEREEIL
jgi:hypothetical protein